MSAFNLPEPTERFTAELFRSWARTLRQADGQNLKRNTDLELGLGKIVLVSPDGTRFGLFVDNDGTLEARPLADGFGHSTGTHTAFDSAFDGAFA